MNNNEKAYNAINSIITGNHQLSHCNPLGEVQYLLTLIGNYNPYKEERLLFKRFALTQLNMWKEDLILGGCKLQE